MRPLLTRKDVGQSSFIPGAVNTLSATLQANFELPGGAVLVIGGLTGSGTGSGRVVVRTRPEGVIEGGVGVWEQERGSLRLTVGGDDTGWMLGVVVLFNLTNPSSARDSANVTVSVLGSGIESRKEIQACGRARRRCWG